MGHKHWCACGLLLLATGFAVAAQPADDALANHIAAATVSLGANERAVLAKIPDANRRFLALRAYVRAGTDLESRWSWTDEQIRSYEQSSEYRRLLDDIAAVTQRFEQQNPGHTLYANSRVRSLETQIARWNENPGVGTTASELNAEAQSVLRAGPRRPDARSLDRFRQFLSGWRPSTASPLAAPGLSPHGQSRAIDFQIMRANDVVAATEVNAVAAQWEAPGWSRRLKQAIDAAGGRFRGPLLAPDEPWHYEYSGLGAQPPTR